MIEDGVFVYIKLTDDEIIQWEFMQHRSIECLLRKKKSLRARFTYGIIFSLVNLVAWFLRDFGQRASLHFHVLKTYGPEGHECFQTMGVLRMSLGCFVSFFSEKGELARVGAGIFLILQLISVIEFIAWWNAYWMPDERKKRRSGRNKGLVFYMASLCGIIAMYAMYTSKPSCTHNIFFITWTAILLLVMMVISLRSKGFLIGVSAIVMATFSTGIDSETFQLQKQVDQMEDGIPYNYGFFHLIFSFGARHFAVLFISWNLDSSTRKWSVNVGWESTWFKIVNEWLAAKIYLWKLIWPIVRQPRIMNHEEPMQQDQQ
ncbi:serinc-domain containing serine and sphingolipid biosynthesis protein [Artemisia annua]|uniref:Serinc-domain containing serine and sphingolipid biosynthesis protein n=1 Tax=Artemisia annua TaxID=35608 RepID=A0A2U1QBZ1_ARTAN|nr:serinc-domain containing serine and sphingolipid biosynthesis protein [Artemisia annua]